MNDYLEALAFNHIPPPPKAVYIRRGVENLTCRAVPTVLSVNAVCTLCGREGHSATTCPWRQS